MNVGIHQTDYIPWLGLFYKVYLSGVFIHLGDAQYPNEAARNYNKIKASNGELRLRFLVGQHMGNLINEVRPEYGLGQNEKHPRTTEMNYSKAPFFEETFPEIEEPYMTRFATVADLNIVINEFIASKFGIKPKFTRSSKLDVQTRREEKVTDLASAVDGNRYISGNGACTYQTKEYFTDRDIELWYLDYGPITYPQIRGEFLPYMSVLDYIFNCGYDFEYITSEVNKINATL